MANHHLERKILRGAAGPEVQKALATSENPLSIASAITALTQTFSAQALESIDDNLDTPEHHVLEIYTSLDRLHHYLNAITTILKRDNQSYQKLLTPQCGQEFEQLLKNLQTIALRLNISWTVENRPQESNPAESTPEHLEKFLRQTMAPKNQPGNDETLTNFADKYALLNLIKSLSDYVSAIQKTIEDKRGDFDTFCAPQCTDEAMELAAQSSQNLRRLSADFAPEAIAVYPGDIENEEDEYEKVLAQLEKMKKSNKLVRLFRLLAQNRSDILLGDPEINRHFSRGEIRQFQMALYRSVANLTIGILDAIPAGPGEATSWTADGLKIIKHYVRRHQHQIKLLKKIFPDWLDLTPDVSITEAVLSELTEIPTGGFMPSHLTFEFRKQFKADLPRLIEFLEKLAKVRAQVLDKEKDHYIRVLGLNEQEDRELLKSLKAYLRN